ncbi:MAG TPA: nucleotidyl transferase AbiEii/AbiGii toxin family protein [Conexibacter sp.]|nr:nucleotidyl transferase AbiEii/AbiGii toxin family protein [Conexibacter sp.]
MTEPSLPDKVVAIHAELRGARVGHAFGGALALAYYAEPRATIDIDLNVFVAPERHAAVHAALRPLGVGDEVDAAALARDGQCRWWWGRTPVDLFFAYDELHDAMRRAVRTVPFGEGTTIPILSPEHLAVCKAVFDRPKDWLDIEQVLVCEADLDVAEVERWLSRIAGPSDRRTVRFGELAAATR